MDVRCAVSACPDRERRSTDASGVEEADIKTTRLDLHQIRRRDRATDRVTAFWQARNRVTATVRDIDSTGAVIDAAIAAGATDIDRVQFQATDPSAALATARGEAVAVAESAASQLALAAGVEVTGVLSIVEGSRYGGPIPTGGLGLGDAALRQSATPIQLGTIDITVTVYVEYEVS